MKRATLRHLLVATALLCTCAKTVHATPAAQVWIPSTDTQPFGTVRLNILNFFRASGVPRSTTASRDPSMLDIGPTIGILPYEKIKMEAGFDYMTLAGDPNDNHPFSFNAKIATPEDSLCKFSPALAIGGYNLGPSVSAVDAPFVTSGQNIVYALAARTLPVVGRISAGYYRGSRHALVDSRLDPEKAQNEGLLLSWDRPMPEISDKLWVGVDYMGGNNINGSVNFGVSWAFAKNASLLVGYDVWKEKSLAGNNSFTTQLGINFP